MESGAGERSSADMDDVWKLIAAADRWDDLVLPEHERILLSSLPGLLEAADGEPGRERDRDGGPERDRAGLLLLFAGEIGTGKTLAARLLAGELGAPVLEVDLARLLARAPDEAEALLERAWAIARQRRAVVVLDAAGSLLAAHGVSDADAAPDIRRVLERAALHPGVVILSSRLTRSIDSDIAGRFDAIVQFPFPDARARRKLWSRFLSANGDAFISRGELELLAESFRLPGATIRSCCLAAAAAAQAAREPLKAVHLAHALEREYRDCVMGEQTRSALALLLTPEDAQPEEAMSPATAREPRRSRRPRRPLTPRTPRSRRPRPRPAPALLAALLAAAGGFAVSQARSGVVAEPVSQRTNVGLLEVSYPATWHRSRLPAATPLALSDGVALAPPSAHGALLVIGRIAGVDGAALPTSLLSSVPRPPAPQTVTLGEGRFYRYAGSGSQTVYAMASTVGAVVAFCTPGTAGPAFATSCERVLSTVRLSAGGALAPGVSIRYAAALNQAIARLNATRAHLGALLAEASTAAAQQRAAHALAQAHATAASALERLQRVAGAGAAANSTLISALRLLASAYDALAAADARQDAHAYATAGQAINQANRRLGYALEELSPIGYRVG